MDDLGKPRLLQCLSCGDKLLGADNEAVATGYRPAVVARGICSPQAAEVIQIHCVVDQGCLVNSQFDNLLETIRASTSCTL